MHQIINEDEDIAFDSTKDEHTHNSYDAHNEPAHDHKPSYHPFLMPAAILIAALLISGTLIATRKGSADIAANPIPTEDTSPVDIAVNKDTDHILGNKDAKVTIVEFSDFQCPFCRSFYEGAYPQLKKDYIDTGKARLVFRYYPLDFHPAAKPAAEGTECAAEQGKFWEMHDKLFQEQAKKGQGTVTFTKQDVKKWGASIRLTNLSQFNKCVDSDKYAQKIDSDLAYGSSIGVSGTPSFFVNGKRIVGAQPFSNFQALIEESLK